MNAPVKFKWKKKYPPTVYGVKEFVCLSVCYGENIKKRPKTWLRPANSKQSTCSLVKIHNTLQLQFSFLEKILILDLLIEN